MKKKLQHYFQFIILTTMLLFIVAHVNATEYTITFSASGASTSIDRVVVQNLTKETTQTVFSGDIFKLSYVSTSVSQTEMNKNYLHISPNPQIDNSKVSFYVPQSCDVQVAVLDINGRRITSINKMCESGENSFRLSLQQGIFILNITGNGIAYTSKIVSKSNSILSPSITDFNTLLPSKTKSKVKQDLVTMVYSPGDHLLFTAYSGNYSNIVTDFNITDNKDIPFVFDACVDANGFNYTTVKIGNQTWMAEDLKSTKYRNGDNITYVYDNWESATSGAYCYNSSAFGGKLYNFLAVTDSRNLAPQGWHIPSNDEWAILTTFLGGDNAAGSKMKSTNWRLWTTGNRDATNESGFNALPGGTRNYSDFSGLNTNATWWSTTLYSQDPTQQAWYLNVYCQTTEAFRYYTSMKYGLSIRCLKD